jgi:hypothetical protein
MRGLTRESAGRFTVRRKGRVASTPFEGYTAAPLENAVKEGWPSG